MKIPKNLTPEEFKKYFNINYKRLDLLNDYVNGSTKVKVQCQYDDNEWEVFPRDVYEDENMSCKQCNRVRANIELKKQFTREYPTMEIATPDIFSDDKTTIICKECGDRFEVYRKHLIGNNIRNFSTPVDVIDIVFFKDRKTPFECPSCKINIVKSEFEDKVKERNCSIIGDYTNNTAPVLIKCNVCETEYSVIPAYYINKIVSKCKFCKKEDKGGNSKWDFLKREEIWKNKIKF